MLVPARDESRFGVEQMKPHETVPAKNARSRRQWATVYDLPIPIELREEWRRLATRRHFLGKWARRLAGASSYFALAMMMPGASRAATEFVAASSAITCQLSAQAKRAIYLFMSGARLRWILWDTSRGLQVSTIRTCPNPCAAIKRSQA